MTSRYPPPPVAARSVAWLDENPVDKHEHGWDDVRDSWEWDRYTATAAQTIANTTTETTLFGSGVGTLDFPVNFFRAGDLVQVHMRGQLSDTGTPNFTISFDLGSTTIASVGPTALTGVSNVEWMLTLMLTCRSKGPSGAFIGGGLFDYDDGTEESLSSGTEVTVDTTQRLTLDATWTWGTAAAANTITCQEAFVEARSPNRIGF